jgi:hypothetical protein
MSREKVQKLPCAVMVPATGGEEAKGVQVPLRVLLAVVNLIMYFVAL